MSHHVPRNIYHAAWEFLSVIYLHWNAVSFVQILVTRHCIATFITRGPLYVAVQIASTQVLQAVALVRNFCFSTQPIRFPTWWIQRVCGIRYSDKQFGYPWWNDERLADMMLLFKNVAFQSSWKRSVPGQHEEHSLLKLSSQLTCSVWRDMSVDGQWARQKPISLHQSKC